MGNAHIVTLSGFGSLTSVTYLPLASKIFDYAVDHNVPDPAKILITTTTNFFTSLVMDPLEVEQYKNIVLLTYVSH